MDSVDWSLFIKQSMYGIRTYLMKEDPKNIPVAQTRFKRWIKLWIFKAACELFLYNLFFIRSIHRLKAIHYITVYTFRATALYVIYKLLVKFLVPFL